MQHYYDTLGIKINSTEEEIKKAYREKAKEYHPDKHINLSEGMRALAEQEFKRVTEAYEEIINSLKQKGKTTSGKTNENRGNYNLKDNQFHLLDKIITFSYELLEHNKFKCIQSNNVDKAIQFARKEYLNAKNMENYINTLEGIADYLISTLKEYIGILNKLGYYNFRTEDDILELSNFTIFDKLESYMNNLEHQYYEIIDNKKNSTNQRLLKKEIRRIYNKGGVRNIISKVSISAEANIRLSNLYKNPKTLEGLCDAIYSFYERVTYFCCLISEFSQWNEVTNPERAELLLNKLMQNSSQDLSVLLTEALENDPYNENVYCAILVHYFDKNKELEKIGSVFGIDILKIKNAIIKEAFEKKLESNYNKNQLKIEMEELSFNLGLRNDENIFYRRVQQAVKEEDEVDNLNKNGYVGVNKKIYMLLSFIIGTMGIHKFYSKKYLHGIIYFSLGYFIDWGVPLALAWVDTAIALFKKSNGNGMIFYKKGFLNFN